MTRYATLGYLINDNKVLLGKKKYGGAKGKLNGFGGKVDDTDKTFKDALIREFYEETSLKIRDPQLKGTLSFAQEESEHVIHVYMITDHDGTPKESDEMSVSWYKFSEIDQDEMWPNDKIWFGLLQLPFKFVATFKGPKVNDHETDISIRLLEELDEESYKKL